jgi:predicted RNA-binding Zn-ribbon protein involved in translation (DUF1610 family)
MPKYRVLEFKCPVCQKEIVRECDDRKDHKLKCKCKGGESGNKSKNIKK